MSRSSSILWNKSHPERMRAAEKRYRESHRDEIRERQRLYRLLNHESVLTKQKQRQAKFLHRNPGYTRIHAARWSQNNELKRRVEHIADRKYPIGKTCELCGSTENLVRHHPDYDLPEIFITCCQSCHRYIHSGDDKP